MVKIIAVAHSLFLFLQVLNSVCNAVQSHKVNLLAADLDTDGIWWYTLAIDSILIDNYSPFLASGCYSSFLGSFPLGVELCAGCGAVA